MLRHHHLPLLLLLFSCFTEEVLSLNQEGIYLLQFKYTLEDPFSSLSDWNPNHPSPCDWTGIHCSSSSPPSVTSINLFNLSIAGPFHPNLCRLPSLTHLDLSENYMNSTLLPSSLHPCSSLTHLDLSDNLIVGDLPSSLASLPSLLRLDLSGNNFTGDIPDSFGRFPKLEGLSLVGNFLSGTVPGFLGNISGLKELNISYNPFSHGVLPTEIGNLSTLERLWAAECNLVGGIPESVGNLRRLRYLDVSNNGLEGEIPTSITLLTSIRQIELYKNNLSGEIPKGLSKLTSLTDFDASENQLVGAIPSDIFDLPSLEVLNLNDNHLVGEVPAAIAKVEKLRQIRLFQNKLTGVIPPDLGKKQPLVFVDLSQNQFTGEIPPGICEMGVLEELMMIENKLSGSLPQSLSGCNSISRLRLSTNLLSGEVPAGVWSLSQVYYFDLAVNSFFGGISTEISRAIKITSLVINGNNFTGSVPEEIGALPNLNTLSAGNNHFTGPLSASLGHIPMLEKLDLHDNNLSGELLTSISSWEKLTELNLKKNGLTGAIPPELGSLPVLNYLDLSDNNLTGEIPNQLENLTLNTFNFSNNDLSGTIPPFFSGNPPQNRFLGNPKLCLSPDSLCPSSKAHSAKNHPNLRILLPIFLLSTVLLAVGIVWFYLRFQKFKKSEKHNRTSGEKSKLKWTFTSFHKLGFSEYEILDNLNEDNVIGSGASGKVYKVDLSSGETVAVKMLWSTPSNKSGGEEEPQTKIKNHNFEAEISTLGKIRHRCIVKLWCSCHHETQDLLVYEHMANGSLGDLLHCNKGGRILDWPMRYRIALDAAEGISYLHHDCVAPIVHRDIKSNNILLDAGFGAKVADFGVAKAFDVVAGNGSKSMSVITGSCGYIAPEYAYTLRVNEKSDVYSFGVVLLELVTGMHPTDPELEEKDLVKWVIATMEQKGIDCVIDPKLDLRLQDEICKVLDIGLKCTRSLPIIRPSMRKVVKLLLEARCGHGALKIQPKYEVELYPNQVSSV